MQSIKKMNLDWEDIRQSASRTPQILKQKTKLGTSHTVDEEFESLNQRFLEVSYNIEKLMTLVPKYGEILKALINNFTNANTAYREIFEPYLSSTDQFALRNSESKSVIENFEKADNLVVEINNYLDACSEIKEGVWNIIDSMNNVISTKMIKIVKILKLVKKFIKKRNYALLDYDECLDSIDKLEIQMNDLTIRKQQHLFSQKRKIEKYQSEYELANSTIKKELPYLFLLIREIVKPIFVEIYFAEISIYHLMSTSLTDIFQRGGGNKYEDFDHIKEQVLSRQKPALEILESLDICDFRDRYLQNLASNISSPTSVIPDFTRDSPDLNKIDNSDYCVALYSFQGIQPGDLSFKSGDTIKIISKNSKEGAMWWIGELSNKQGSFPANYVKC